eukprot:1541450-Rhodomonas_salina.2
MKLLLPGACPGILTTPSPDTVYHFVSTENRMSRAQMNSGGPVPVSAAILAALACEEYLDFLCTCSEMSRQCDERDSPVPDSSSCSGNLGTGSDIARSPPKRLQA